MLLSDILKKKGLTNYKFKSSTAKTPKRKSPRETLIDQINNNLKVLAEPTFRVKNRKGEMIKPDACFKIDGDKAEVWASYSKKRIVLENDKSFVEIPTDQLKDYLEAIKEAAEHGIFDEQLTNIQSSRSKSQQGKTRTKKNK
jgi:hypothetical protein